MDSTENVQKWGSLLNFFLLKALEGVLHQWWKLSLTGLVFVETSTQTYSLSEEDFGYKYGRLESLASHVSRENTLLRCGKIQKCGRNLQRRFVDGRTDGDYLGGRRFVGRVHGVVDNASAVTRVAGHTHMISEKSQRTQNGTMFVDLDWPLNASHRLSASAELLVLAVLDTCSRICLNVFISNDSIGDSSVSDLVWRPCSFPTHIWQHTVVFSQSVWWW